MVFKKQTLVGFIQDALREIDAEQIFFSVEQPQEVTHGDYATNVALIASKKLSISPKEVAEKIKSVMGGKYKEIAHIEIAGPGFINFFLVDENIRESNKQEIGKFETKFTGKKVLVEHSSPNLFKPFHIGHLMNNIVGMFVARAVEAGGGHVTEMSFPSDVSIGIAKAMFILLEDKKNGVNFETRNIDEQIVYFGEAYIRGLAYFDEHKDELPKAQAIAHIIFDDTSISEEYTMYSFVKKKNIDYFISILQGLGSKIDSQTGIIFESISGRRGRTIVEENTGEGKVFTKSEGAIVYIPDEARKDLHTAVFINSEGYPTYEAKDLGLIDKKFEIYNPDTSFFITDAEQVSHFKIVLDAASKLGEVWKERIEKSKHIPHGRMLFKGQKMSSRLGGVPLALDVISVVEDEVKERAGEKIAHLGKEEKKKLEREIALSALRIAVLRSKPGININFDPESSLSFEGDSGPYLLYTHARCASLLDKGNITPKFGIYTVSELERNLIHAEEVFVNSIEDLSPQILVGYLFSIAQLFNTWYAQEQILSDDKEKTAHKLAVVLRVKTVLYRGLYMVGIEAPPRL